MKRTPYQVVRRPIITEKALDVKEQARTLCFQVHHNASKVEIREAVQKIFKFFSLQPLLLLWIRVQRKCE